MLTFFRKIRKALMDSGSTRKYLLYAIGEIALVVIGILIALQINNWNIDRLNRISEREGLARIVQDLKKDLENIGRSQRFNDLRLLRGVQVLEKLGTNASEIKNWEAYKLAKRSGEYPPASNSFGKLLLSLRFYYLFEESRATFQDFLSTGKLDIIRDRELKALIQSYYSGLEYNTNYQHLLLQNRNALVMFLRKHGISMMNTMNLEQTMNQIEDKEELVAIIENFLFITRTAYSNQILNKESVRNLVMVLIDRIEEYLE